MFRIPIPDNLILESRLVTAGVIQGEILLAFWLVSGWAPRAARVVAITVFVVFAVSSLSLALRAETSCGCFGMVEINPWVTTVIDIAAIGLLVFWQPGKMTTRIAELRQNGLLWALAGVMFVSGLLARGPATVTLDNLGSESGYVIIEPELWLGQPLPVADYIETDCELLRGKWTLVLFHEDCQLCQELIDDLMANTSSPTLFVEVPPCAAIERAAGQHYGWARLTEEYQWFVRAPVAIELMEGVVENVQIREALRARSGG